MRYIPLLAAAVALAIPSLAPAATPAAPAGAKNIILVHDAFVDGSGWRVVHDILIHKGYKVSVVQLPHTTLGDDIAVVRERISMQIGPVVMVGHGYGGLVITEAGARSKVKALVYVAGMEPDVGEGMNQLNASMPAAAASSVRSTRDGHLFIDSARFNADYAADLKSNRTDFMAASQVPVPGALFAGNVWSAAWREKPSYGIVATEDRVLNPDLQRWMYKRAGAKVTEIKASHALPISQPEAVAQVIEEAARNS
ncbi:alpha/beta fold hydrolase [Cupriavidus basilensis]|jgi:pimeloyl-ACP methyl ester carboxylesterase|uniref:alpha/beta fold hydrolase n=1 Tax=Cupriavidus basilensis TaxID=68895 RepID=UPI0023E7CCAD|nr:alpha/beta hydrolase [Cupriavidus basilensis]MDF3884027.1 alpha/beta hydrolase [Cupriavidus basilensis]